MTETTYNYYNNEIGKLVWYRARYNEAHNETCNNLEEVNSLIHIIKPKKLSFINNRRIKNFK